MGLSRTDPPASGAHPGNAPPVGLAVRHFTPHRGVIWTRPRAVSLIGNAVSGSFSGSRLAALFVHSLVPISLVYAAAHYVSALVFEGQRLATLASYPLGDGKDLFGTADATVDYGIVGATTFWYLQVAFVVAGHVAALVLAHDRALVVYDRAKLAVRSQYWMLAVMVGYTSLAPWVLSQANRG